MFDHGNEQRSEAASYAFPQAEKFYCFMEKKKALTSYFHFT